MCESEMSLEKPAVVIDNGSYSIKAGFACDNHPVSIFRTVVGRPSYLQGSYGKQFYDVFIGDDAMAKSEDLDLNKPVINGRVVHWDNMERIWHHVFYKELKVAPEDRAVILGCAAKTPMKEKIKCCEVFFETLNTPELCVQSQSVLSLYGSGYTTGLSVDLGYDTTDICPIYEGGPLIYAHIETNVAGTQISDYIKRLLEDRELNYGLQTPPIVEGIIKNCMYVTKNASMARNNYEKSYVLPDGQRVNVCQESFMAVELLFQPDLVLGSKTNYVPLPDAVVTSAMKCDPELRSDLFDAVVPCGGLAQLPGLNERLAAEMEEITQTPVNVISSPEAYAIAWLGGATFAGLPESKKMFVRKNQYEDQGARIVTNKFL